MRHLSSARGYPRRVLSLPRLRKRLPLVVFLLLVVLLLMMVAVACACATDHPMKSADRVVSSIAAAPAVLEVWKYSFAPLLVVTFFVSEPRRPRGRESPAQLQRFLF